MINLIKKDIKLTFLTKSTLLFLILYIPMLVLLDLGDVRMTYLAAVLTFTYMSLTVPFQYELKNKTHILIQSLPVAKINIVVSRYIYSVLTFLFSTVFVFLYFKTLSTFGLNFDIEFSLDVFKQVLFTVFIAISLLLPIHFMFEPKTASFLGIFLYASIFTLLSTIDSWINKLNLTVNSSLLFSGTIVLIFLLSMTISIFIYNRRNFS